MNVYFHRQANGNTGRGHRAGQVPFRLGAALYLLLLFSGSLAAQQTITVTIDAKGPKKPVSPYIYGRNNSLYDGFNSQVSAATWTKYRDSGLRMFREGGGNNSTKYNWRKKLSSHPDWYNNVYPHDWDISAKSLQQNLPGTQGMYTFPLLGRVAGNRNNNFNDWAYNRSQWWEGCGQNLAGGGTVNPAGTGKALQEGNPDLYLDPWPPDSATAILKHWFGPEGIGLDTNSFRCWSMDNEPEIWNGTHDDVMPVQISAGEFMQRYFETAKKARALYPGIKLSGPVPANEWQWYNWNGNAVSYGGKSYVWLEYFIKRVADEQKATGIRLLDLLDIHFYPHETAPAEILQTHRIFFDRNYIYPGHNGVHRIGGGWNSSINKEYIFERCREWLEKYIGPGHGVTFAVTESSVDGNAPVMVKTVWYASMLGEFARQGVEVFTPWDWRPGMYEVAHLFTRYGFASSLPALSTDEVTVSAYPSVNEAADSMTVVLVNRSLDQARTVDLHLKNFSLSSAILPVRQLKNLTGETFVSRQQNALATGTVLAGGDTVSLTLPPLSVTSLTMAGTVTAGKIIPLPGGKQGELLLYPNPARDFITVSWSPSLNDGGTLELMDPDGRLLRTFVLDRRQMRAGTARFATTAWPGGLLFLRLKTPDCSLTRPLLLTGGH